MKFELKRDLPGFHSRRAASTQLEYYATEADGPDVIAIGDE
jgi:hypothetical protein